MEGPESDWVPIFMYQDGHGTYRTGAIPEMTRENLAAGADGLGRLLAGAEAVQAALVLPVWLTQIQRSGVGRTERVMVTHVTRNHTRCEMATVIRSKTATPRLGSWHRVAGNVELGVGMFIDAMRTAITGTGGNGRPTG
jgi:hypothetical protein